MANRICIFRHNFYPMDVRVSRQATALLAAGFEVDVICLRDENEPPREQVRGVSVYRLPVTHRRASRARYVVEYLSSLVFGMLMLTALHLRRRYDVIQVSNMPDFLVFAALVPKLLGTKIVLDVLDSMPELYMAKYNVSANHPLTRLVAWQEGMSMRFADRVLTVTDEFRKLFVQRHGDSEIQIILNLPDHTRWPRKFPDHDRAVSPQQPNHFILMAHGVLLPRLGFDTIIRAAALIRAEIPALELRIVGSGQNESDLRALADQLGVADCVRFYGFIPLDQLPALIDDADIGIVANKRDGFSELLLPTKLLELVWMGKPVIAARTDTIAHYFDDGMLAYFEPGNERDLAERILDLYRMPELRYRLSLNATRFFSQHNWQSEGERYRETLLDLLHAPSPAGTVASR